MNGWVRPLFGFLSLLVASASLPASSQTEAPILITINNTPFRDAFHNLATQAGGNYILDPRVEGKPVNVRWENLTAKEAIDRLLKEQGFTTVYSPATTVCRIVGTNLDVKPVPAEQILGDTNAVSLIMFDDTPLTMVVGNLARQAKLEVELDSKLTEPTRNAEGRFIMPPQISVSARWKDISAAQALAALLDNYGLTATKDPTSGKVHVAPKESPATPAPSKSK